MTSLTLLASFLVTVVSAAPTPPPTPVETTRPAAVTQAIAAAHKSMKAKLLKATPRATIELREEAGPFGTVLAVAAQADAYPGTGVMRTVIDAKTGATYGARGTKTFADFVRARGWLAQLPTSDELIMFVNLSLFDGIAILDRAADESIDLIPDGLRIVLVRRYMPSNAGERWVIVVGRAGAEKITKDPLRE